MPTDIKIPPAKVARIIERFRHHLDRFHQRSAPASAAMFEMVVGAWVAQAINVAAELGIADALVDRPLPLADLADRVGADPDALRRLMRALIGRGIFRQRRDGRYDLTAVAETLRSDAPFSMRGYARLLGSPQHREHWSLLGESVKSGKAILPQLRGKEAFDYLRDEPELAKLFNDAMTGLDGSGGDHCRSPATALILTARSSMSAAGTGGCCPPSWRRHRTRGASSMTCLKSSQVRPSCSLSAESKTGFASRAGRSSTASRPAATPMSSKTSSTTGPMSRPLRSCVTSGRPPAPIRRCC